MKRSFRRHRNPKGDKDRQPFFGKSKQRQAHTKKSDGAFFQTKLTLGKPGDKYEKEADTVADAVVNQSTSTPEINKKEISSIQRVNLATPIEDENLATAEQRLEKDKLIQEKPELQTMGEEKEEEKPETQMQAEEEEPEMQMQSEEDEPEMQMQEEEEEPVQAMHQEEEPEVQQKCDECEKEEEGAVQKKSTTAATKASPKVSNQIKQSHGKGKPLSPKVRAEMESSIGANFKGVNIHTNTEAVELNKKLKAQAFTHGKDIYFNSGKYRPESTDGKRLLAHELTHVVQQSKDHEAIQKQDAGATTFELNVTPQLQWAIHALLIRPRREEATWACLAAAPEYDRPRIIINYLIQYQGNSAFQQINRQRPAGMDSFDYLNSVGNFIWSHMRDAFMARINDRLARNEQFRQRVETARHQGCSRVPFTQRGGMRGV